MNKKRPEEGSSDVSDFEDSPVSSSSSSEDLMGSTVDQEIRLLQQKVKNTKKSREVTTRRVNIKSVKGKGKQPKRPRASKNFYFEQYRPSVKQEFPDLRFGEISKILGERWIELPQEEKKAF